ncbi:MAG: ribosome silencing factor [bacterium]
MTQKKSTEFAKTLAQHASSAKAIDIKILDLRGHSSFTDFFVICSGTSDRQMRAICDKATEELKKTGIRPISVEGYEHGQWVLVDFGDAVLHVFNEESRPHYDLEGFWKKVPRLRFTEAKKRKVKAKSETKVASRRKAQGSRRS